MVREGPPGVIPRQAPTIGWLAVSVAAFCAAAEWDVAVRASPNPPAPIPARAVRRETEGAIRLVVIRMLLCYFGLSRCATSNASLLRRSSAELFSRFGVTGTPNNRSFALLGCARPSPVRVVDDRA